MRIVSAMLVLIMLCSCSSSVKKPPVITDGFSCTVTAEYEDSQTEFKLKKESETITVEYLSPSDIKGMVVDISPAGKYVSYEGITTALNDDLLSASLIGAVIDIIIEAGNDNADYKELETREATQADINKFFG